MLPIVDRKSLYKNEAGILVRLQEALSGEIGQNTTANGVLSFCARGVERGKKIDAALSKILTKL